MGRVAERRVLLRAGKPPGRGGIRPERVMCLGFLALIIIGALLLALPAAAATGESIGILNSVFTATSAVCVTGLIVVDTGTTFSLFGQLVLLVLIQTGGLGFMTFAGMMMAALGRHATLRERMLLRESLNTTTLRGLIPLICRYALLALAMEGAGAAVLSVRLIPMYGWRRGSFYALWHAVSAFCNAGFDLFGGQGSLTAFRQDPLVLLTVSLLIMLGGTGFAVIAELIQRRLRWRRFSLHAKLVLVLTAALLLAGTAFIAAAEWQNPATLGSLPGPGGRLLNAFFQSVTMRTAGFNSIELSGLRDGTKLFCVLLMLVGASPASTGGGVKTMTAAVAVMAVWAEIRGREDITVLGRRLPGDLVRRAMTIICVTFALYLTGSMVLLLLEDGRFPVIDMLFEAASAMGTVGVTSIGTRQLTSASRITLALMMYLGRVGPLTMALALGGDGGKGGAGLRYPEEQVTIG